MHYLLIKYVASRFTSLFKGFIDSEKVAGLLLVVCTIIFLLMGNSSQGDKYIYFMEGTVTSILK
jgi:Na+/H+ antiporter NhaA